MEYPDEYSPLRPGGLSLTEQLLLMGGEIKKRRVLDLGCGRGETARLLEEEYSACVTGVDFSAALIDECRRNDPGITFVTADAQDLPFEDGSFDVVVSECSFSVFQDPEKALKEAHRVLVSGGRLLLSDLWKEGEETSGSGMVRSLYSKTAWQNMVSTAGFAVKDFIDVRDVLKEMYVQMIFDLGLEGARKQIGICLPREEMKSVSYMLLSAEKTE